MAVTYTSNTTIWDDATTAPPEVTAKLQSAIQEAVDTKAPRTYRYGKRPTRITTVVYVDKYYRYPELERVVYCARIDEYWVVRDINTYAPRHIKKHRVLVLLTPADLRDV